MPSHFSTFSLFCRISMKIENINIMIKPRFYNVEKSVCCMKQSTWSGRCWQATHLFSFIVASEVFLGFEWFLLHFKLTLSLRCLSYRYQPIDLQRKSKEWFLIDKDLRQERVKGLIIKAIIMFEIIFIVGTHTLPWNYMWSQKNLMTFFWDLVPFVPFN